MVITRKYLVLLACVAVLALVALPAGAAEKSIKVGAYGGYFKDSFDKHIFPDFTKETGIKVESVAEPTGEAWLVQLEQAAKAGVAPADVNMIAQTPMLRGQKTQLWKPLDLNKIPNSKNLMPVFIHKYPDGKVDGIGAVSWYITLVSNTKAFPAAPTSWGDMWARGQEGQARPAGPCHQLLPAGNHRHDLLRRHQDPGYQGRHPESARQARRDQTEREALVPGRGPVRAGSEVGRDPDGPVLSRRRHPGRQGRHPVRSTFPKEGGVLDSGIWALTKACKKVEEAHIFINYMCRPDIQAKLSRQSRHLAHGEEGADRPVSRRSSLRCRATSSRPSRAMTSTPAI